MSKEITIFDIANAFLNFSSMTNKKLQKLCYYAQAWYLTIKNEALVNCDFEAWIHGPVCAKLYFRYKDHGYNPISKTDKLPPAIENDTFLKTFLSVIYKTYGNMSGDELELLTHNELPWLKAREGLKPYEHSNNIISLDDMKSYYSNLLEN